jgi:hypothetical protein
MAPPCIIVVFVTCTHEMSSHARHRPWPSGQPAWGRARSVRVRVEIMGSQKSRIVGKSQSVLMMINPIIFTRTRKHTHTAVDATTGSRGASEGGGRTCICRWRIRLCRAVPTASRASGSATPCPLSEHARRAGGKLSVGRRASVSWGGMFSRGMWSERDVFLLRLCCVRGVLCAGR